MTPLRSARLLLVPAREEDLVAELAGHDALARSLGVSVPAEWPPELYDDDAIRYTLNMLRTTREHRGWTFYYFTLPGFEQRDAELIGAGGFKGAPDPSGEVELGYSIVPKMRRRGYATEATRAMCDFAFTDSRVKTVVGQTLPALAGSIGVMERAGFVFDGQGSDPHAPPGEQVLRYVLTRARYEATR
jgi:ribosomal-protein-alanine N-acetyltransferase